jgi:hypothetical protein
VGASVVGASVVVLVVVVGASVVVVGARVVLVVVVGARVVLVVVVGARVVVVVVGETPCNATQKIDPLYIYYKTIFLIEDYISTCGGVNVAAKAVIAAYCEGFDI